MGPLNFFLGCSQARWRSICMMAELSLALQTALPLIFLIVVVSA